MIEVEQKFFLSPAQQEALLKNAQPISERTFTDTYYDDANYSLTSKDWWLRNRDGRWELKQPLFQDKQDQRTDQYREIETVEGIAAAMNLTAEDFHTVETRHALSLPYAPFASITTNRKKYKNGEFIIDIDHGTVAKSLQNNSFANGFFIRKYSFKMI